MTQQELAEAADLDYKSIQRLEAKIPRFYPKVDTLEKLSRAFGITISDLLRQ
jgi:transcriptional regulator with XRE-family HTH domain